MVFKYIVGLSDLYCALTSNEYHTLAYIPTNTSISIYIEGVSSPATTCIGSNGVSTNLSTAISVGVAFINV